MTQSEPEIIIFSSVVWNFYRTRPHEIAFGLQKHGCAVTFVEPMMYRGGKSTRLQPMANNDRTGMTIVSRTSRLHKGVLLLLVENISNARLVMQHRGAAVISGDIWMTFFAALVARCCGMRFLFDNMDYWPAVEKSVVLKNVVRFFLYPFYGKISYAVLNTSIFLQKYMQRYAKRSVYIPNAKALSDIQWNDQLYQSSPKKVHHRVVFAATLRDWYDYDLLVNIFANFVNIRLDVYGEGPMKDALIQAARPYKNIIVHDALSTAEVTAAVLHSDFGILPLRKIDVTRGVLPIKLLDYWSLHKPVIGSDAEGLLNVQGDGLVIARSLEEWTSVITDWYAHTEVIDEIGEEGFQRLGREYSYDVYIKEIKEYISE